MKRLTPFFRNLTLIVMLISLGVVSPFAVAADIQAGQAKSSTCVACHNIDGNSTSNVYPKIAGQNQRYLVKQMHDFKLGAQGGRNNPIMYGMVAALSDQDIEDISAYFASQTITKGMADQKYVELGQAIYRGGDLERGIPACLACHGPSGEGNASSAYPALAGQFPEYTVAQLQAFSSKQRTNGPNGMMYDIGKKMTEEDMKAVASYIFGLH